jgi:cell division protein FtsW (lipid II flippase)
VGVRFPPHLGRPGARICDDPRVVPDNLHDFFVASAGVAGALVGLLFVAISIAAGRLAAEREEAQLHRVRALAALAAFVNALVVSLVALLPGQDLGPTVLIVAVVGLLLVAASLRSLVRAHQLRGRQKRESLFLVGLLVVFGLQLTQAVLLVQRPDDQRVVGTVAVLVLICFMVGIGRSWELVGAPSVAALVRPGGDEPGPGRDG